MGGRSEITRFTRRRRRLRDESSANGDGDGEGEGETGRTSPSSSSRSTASSPTSPRSADRRMRSPAMVTRSARPRAAAGAGTAGATRAPTSVQCSLEPIVPSECRREAPSKRPWLRAALVAACVAAAAAAAGVLRNAGSVARGGEPPAPFGEVAGAAAALNGTSAWALAERGAPAGADAQLLPDALRALPRQRVALFSANFDYNLDGVALTLNRLVGARARALRASSRRPRRLRAHVPSGARARTPRSPSGFSAQRTCCVRVTPSPSLHRRARIASSRRPSRPAWRAPTGPSSTRGRRRVARSDASAPARRAKRRASCRWLRRPCDAQSLKSRAHARSPRTRPPNARAGRWAGDWRARAAAAAFADAPLAACPGAWPRVCARQVRAHAARTRSRPRRRAARLPPDRRAHCDT